MMPEGRYILISTCDLKVNRICYIGPKLVMKQKEGRRITMCDVAQKLEDKGIKNGRIRMLADFLSSGGSEANAKRMLKVTEEKIAQAKDILCEK